MISELLTSEVLDPMDNAWKEGPPLPEEAGIEGSTPCLEDLGNGKIMFSAIGVGLA